jgi:hypothetical protein
MISDMEPSKPWESVNKLSMKYEFVFPYILEQIDCITNIDLEILLNPRI